jgi:hypothetical protein
MLACLPCLFFSDYPASIEPDLFETPSPFKRRPDCLVTVSPDSTVSTSSENSTDTVTMDLLKRFKRTGKDQRRPSRTKNSSNNNSNNDQSLGGRGQWKDPARLYYPIGDTRDSDSSLSSDNDSNSSGISIGTGTYTDGSIDSHNDDADDEESVESFQALQFEVSLEASASASSLAQSSSAVSVQSKSSVLVGELAFENMSMVYSEDEEGSTTSTVNVSNISALSSQQSLDGLMERDNITGFMKMATPTPNKSSSSATAANAKASCLNMLQLQDRHESDDDSLLSEVSSIFSPDRYFQPQEEVANTNDNDSNEQETSDDYIFTDDKSDPTSPVGRLSVLESAALARSSLLLPPEQQEEEKKEQDRGDSSLTMSPTTWSHYNSARGRKAAKALMQNLRDNTNTPVDDGDTEDEDEKMQTPSRRTESTSTDKRSSSMLGRAVQSLRRKRYTPSSSPLDYQYPSTTNANTQEDVAVSKSLSSSSSQKAPALPEPVVSPSAVYARNKLVDFGSWEARVSPPFITNTSAAATTATTPTTRKTAKAKRAPVSVQLPEEKEQEPRAVVTPTGERKATNFSVKVTSLLSSGETSPTLVSRWTDELDNSALESPRTLAEDMLQSLGLAGDDHARQCLQTLRSRAGVIDDLECLLASDQQGADKDPSHILPWMHIVADVWMPHYEEYVFSTVHAFHRRLLVSSA